MNLWAVIFKVWDDEPVFHDVVRHWSGLRTACGRKVSAPMIPRKHAVKFARKCKSCIAQEANDAS